MFKFSLVFSIIHLSHKGNVNLNYADFFTKLYTLLLLHKTKIKLCKKYFLKFKIIFIKRTKLLFFLNKLVKNRIKNQKHKTN
jgi:hypothetical protein